MPFSFGDFTQAAMGTVVACGRRCVVAWLCDQVVQIIAVPTGCTAVWHFGHDILFVISPDDEFSQFSLIRIHLKNQVSCDCKPFWVPPTLFLTLDFPLIY